MTGAQQFQEVRRGSSSRSCQTRRSDHCRSWVQPHSWPCDAPRYHRRQPRQPFQGRLSQHNRALPHEAVFFHRSARTTWRLEIAIGSRQSSVTIRATVTAPVDYGRRTSGADVARNGRRCRPAWRWPHGASHRRDQRGSRRPRSPRLAAQGPDEKILIPLERELPNFGFRDTTSTMSGACFFLPRSPALSRQHPLGQAFCLLASVHSASACRA